MNKTETIEGYDVVIAGSGPTGCVLAKDLASKGKRVIVLEEGNDSRLFLGSPLALLCGKHTKANLPKSMFTTTIEGDEVLIGHGLGGGTKTYSGASFMPDFEMWRRWGVDLEPYVEQAREESWVSLMPEKFVGPGVLRMMEASAKVGVPMQLMERHAKWDKCEVGCNSSAFGCPHGGKWEGTYAARDAITMGARFLFNTKAENVIIEKGRAVGFLANRKGSNIEVRAKATVSSCGGWASVAIAKKAGIKKAGNSFTGDPMGLSFGLSQSRKPSTAHEHMFACSYDDKKNGLMFAMTGQPRSMWMPSFVMKEGLGALRYLHRHRDLTIVFYKIHDQAKGWVGENGAMSKAYTKQDKDRMEYGWEKNRQILVEFGCDPDNIHRTLVMLGHPSGTVKIGEFLDDHCQSIDIPGLYFCDTSCFPEAPGMPPVLTLVCLAKYEADYLAKVL